jgi:eukaryotic-like serine/threonine-protein kinase
MNADNPSTASVNDDPRLVRAAKEYLAELEAGRRPDRRAFAIRFAELGNELEPYLDALDMFHAASPSAPAVARSGNDGPLSGEPLGDFRIVRQIGHGGMGTVYEAVQLSLARRVALKVLPFAAALDAKQLQRFKNEAQAAAQLHHTNIVPVYGVGCERGVHYYAMQLIEGQNLADTIRQLRPPETNASRAEPADAAITVSAMAADLSTKRARHSEDFYRTVVRFVIQAADALEHAHQFGVIHRDVKPANLMVDALGNVWITDFGLAQFHTGAGLTRTGDLLGTLRYMSPEQAAGLAGPLDARTDVYSLGATLYELLTLQPMFDGDNHQRLLQQILNDEPRPPRAVDRAVPSELETIVLKAISKNPVDRYTTARELADDLRRFVDNRPILARRPTLPQRLRKLARRHPSVVVAGVVLLILVAAGSLVTAGLVEAAYQRERLRAEEAETQTRIAKQAVEEAKTQTHIAQRAVADAEAEFRVAQRAVNEMIEIGNDELAGHPQLDGLRKRLLMSTLVYDQECIDRRRGDPAAQEELRETKARVEKVVAELAVLEGAGLVNLLGQPAVLDDLKVVGAERQQVSSLADRLVKQADTMFRGLGKLTEEERRQRILDQVRAEEVAINAILTAEQVRRLRQIALQSRGVAAFRTAVVATALKLTAEQRKQIRTIESETYFGPPHGKRFGPHDDKRPGPREGKPGDMSPGNFHKGYEKRQRAAVQQVLTAVLSPEQTRAWWDLAGPRFEGPISFPQMFGPGGPRKAPGGPTGKGYGGASGPPGKHS